MLLPCEDITLRSLVESRRGRRVGRWDYLPGDIEAGLASLLEREIDLQRRLERLKDALSARYDFSMNGAFRAIDRYNDGFIDTFNLDRFLKGHGAYLSQKELLAIIRRIDTDGDARLGYSEFSDFARCEFPPVRMGIAEDDLKSRSFSASRRALTESSPLRSSRARAHSAYGGARRVTFETPQK